MKKKIVAIIALVGMVSSLAMGCGSTKLQNEYITITQYKGLRIPEAQPIEVTDEDIERQIETLREMHSPLNEVTDRPAEEGDTVKFDYKGFMNGEAFERGEQEGAETVIGAGGFIEGFDEGIIGRNPGDEFELEVTFPDPYPQSPEMAGQPAVFEIKLHTISKKEYLEINDEFAQTVPGTAETLDELKAEIREQQETQAEDSVKASMENAVWMALQENVEVKKLPEDRVEEIVTASRETYEGYAESYEMEYAEFIEAYFQMDEAGLEEMMLEQAENRIMMEMATDLIAEKEKLVPTEKEYQERYEEMAEEFNFESVEALIEQATEEMLQSMILQERVGEFLIEHAEQVSAEELEKEAEEKAAAQAEESANAETEEDSNAEEDATEEGDTSTDDDNAEDAGAQIESNEEESTEE
jgi:trigger factor